MATAERAPIVGPIPSDPREIVEVRVGDVFVDRNAQREVDEERVARIAQEFDWAIFEMPTCSRMPDDMLRVDEGQHRIQALKRRDPNVVVRVLVLPGVLTLAEEAGYARAIATGRKPHSALAKWELRVRSGCPHEVAAEEVLRMHGLRLGAKGSPTAIASVGIVNGLIHANRQTPEMGAETLNLVLDIIERAYPRDEPDSATFRWNHHLLKAVGELVIRNPQLEPRRLITTLRDRIAQQWVTQAIANEAPTWQLIGEALTGKYNKGIRNAKRRISL